MSLEGLGLIVAVVFIVFSFIGLLVTRYKKCPSDKIMVIYGRVGKNSDGTGQSARCVHGGASFIVPIIQAYQYLDLTPITIPVDLRNALSKQNIRIDVPSVFTVGISTEDGVMQNAAERLLGLNNAGIQDLAKDIIFGQLRLVIATMNIEEINTDRDKFLDEVSKNVEVELKKIGLRLINVNLTDISDESGYIKALGKEAAAKAINDAKKSVAEKNKDGSIGEANAEKEQRIEVANAESAANVGEAKAMKDQRMLMAEAEAIAVEGENKAAISMAMSNALRKEKEAEALKIAISAEKIQQAKALEESYEAERKAELARSNKEKATLEANVIVKAEIEKRKIELDAEAKAEQIRIQAKAEADAIYLKMEAEARGMQEILSKQASGFNEIVKSAGGKADDALKMLLADKMEDLMRVQVEAIKNIKIDKITVWDSGGTDGQTSTANFLSGLMKSIPPINEMFDNAGMKLPSYFGDVKKEEPSV